MLLKTSPALIDRRYQLLNQLGAGGMGQLYRAFDYLSGRSVALKRVLLPPAAPKGLPVKDDSVTGRLALAQEFKILASLHHPYVISVLDYGFDEQRQPYFTMDLLENVQTILAAGVQEPRALQFDLLMQLLEALTYIHQRRVLHLDLKPSNVLVDQGQVKLLDFGLSVTREHANEVFGGTLAYMAPEMFLGQPVSEATDLFAFGILACELLTEVHPFMREETDNLVSNILNTPADLSSFDLEKPIIQVLERLLAKSPEARYQDARQVMADLSAALHHRLLVETPLVRESLLEAARFIGREAALEQLTTALMDLPGGKGSAWLIGGESGVGKSRFLEELRVRALIQGIHVLRGQMISEGSKPYELWRPVLRWLVIITELSEFEASVLKALVPDISELLGRDIPAAPAIDAQASLERILAVIEALFRRQQQPLVVMLEDLQWANASLDVLGRLGPILEGLPILMVGSYRDDERADLPAKLSAMQVLTLERFSVQETTELSEAMLGPVGREPAIIELLYRETDGNAFFLVEVVRALAEEAGGLNHITTTALPQSILTGGIKRLVLRRMERIPERARPLLHIAAVLGRRLDLDLLAAIEPAVDIPQWLYMGADAAILETQAGTWQFVHDKFREGLLSRLTSLESQRLHQRVAEAIEQFDPEPSKQAGSLVHHWRIAGNPDKELQYSILAGEQALAAGAYQLAVKLLGRALELQEQLGASDLNKALIARQIGEASLGIGRAQQSAQELRRVVAWLGFPQPAGTRQQRLGFLGQLAKQAAFRLLPDAWLRRSRIPQETLLEASRAYERLAHIYFISNERLLCVYAGLQTMNLAETAGPSPERTRGYANLSVLTNLLSLRRLANMYRQKAEAGLLQTADLATHVWVQEVIGIHYLSKGELLPARKRFEQALEACEALGDWRRVDEIKGALAIALCHQGEYAPSAKLFSEMAATGKQRGDVQSYRLGLACLLDDALRRGDMERAATYISGIEATLDETDKLSDFMCVGPLAAFYWTQGNRRMAQQIAERSLQHIRQSPPAAYLALQGYWGMTEVHLHLWQFSHNASVAEKRLLRRGARSACDAFNQYARIFPLGRPRALLYEGVYQWLNQQPAKAFAQWQKSLAVAEQFQMPYEQGLAHLEIGSHLDAQDPKCKEHLVRAREIFKQLGADFDFKRAESALEPPDDLLIQIES